MREPGPLDMGIQIYVDTSSAVGTMTVATCSAAALLTTGWCLLSGALHIPLYSPWPRTATDRVVLDMVGRDQLCTCGLHFGGGESCIRNSTMVHGKSSSLYMVCRQFDVAKIVCFMHSGNCCSSYACKHAAVAAVVWHYTECFCCSKPCLSFHTRVADQYTLPCTGNINMPES